MEIFKTSYMNNKIKKINFNHSFTFFLFCNIFSLIIFEINYPNFTSILCLLLILIIGVSHGSLDHVKGKKLFKIFDINKFYLFYIFYVIISISIIIFWLLTPSISLLIFLIVASYHFGKEDTQFLIDRNSILNQILFFFKGLLIILAPMFFHFSETIDIFRFLLVENENFYQVLALVETNHILLTGIIISTLASVFLFLNQYEIKKLTIFFDYLSIIILNYNFSPLIAFTIYFCFLHSFRHSISLIYEIDNSNFANGLKIFLKKALPLTFLTTILCLISIYFLTNNYELDSSILKIIFIGLASLTFPHILLEYLIEKNEK